MRRLDSVSQFVNKDLNEVNSNGTVSEPPGVDLIGKVFQPIMSWELFNNAYWFNSLAPERCESSFISLFFKLILCIDILSTPFKSGSKCVSQNHIDDNSVLVQVMAWCRQSILYINLSPGAIHKHDRLVHPKKYAFLYLLRNYIQFKFEARLLFVWDSMPQCFTEIILTCDDENTRWTSP